MYLTSLATAPGDEVPINELREVIESGSAPSLEAEGIKFARVFDDTRTEMAIRCARSSTSAVAVDTMVYATMTGKVDPGQEHAWEADLVVSGAGLDSARLIGIGNNRCANFGAMLTVATAMIKAGYSNRCLLVTVDSAPPESRLMPGAVGVLSDAAASGVVSEDPGPGPTYRILAIEAVYRAELGVVNDIRKAPDAAAMFLEDIEHAVGRLCAAANVALAQFTHLVVNNYRSSAVAPLSEIVELPRSLVYRDAAAEFGHCYAADSIINVAHLATSGKVRHGDRVLVLCTAVNTWTLIALQYVSP